MIKIKHCPKYDMIKYTNLSLKTFLNIFDTRMTKSCITNPQNLTSKIHQTPDFIDALLVEEYLEVPSLSPNQSLLSSLSGKEYVKITQKDFTVYPHSRCLYGFHVKCRPESFFNESVNLTSK